VAAYASLTTHAPDSAHIVVPVVTIMTDAVHMPATISTTHKLSSSLTAEVD
jgi:hypothetical protein